MIFYLDSKEHIILLHNNMTLSLFLMNAKVRERSYMGRIMGEIYQSLTVPNINLRDEFDDYYSAEYDSFKDFLHKKYPVLTDDNIFQICQILEDANYNIFRGYFGQMDCYNIHTLFEHADGFHEKVLSFLEYK